MTNVTTTLPALQQQFTVYKHYYSIYAYCTLHREGGGGRAM